MIHKSLIHGLNIDLDVGSNEIPFDYLGMITRAEINSRKIWD